MASHEGGCLCGALRFRAEGAPLRVGICHCTMCRRNTGSAYGATAVFPRDKVTIAGESSCYESSPQSRRCFCPKCGSPVYSTWGKLGEIDLNIGAFDDPAPLPPTYELWTSECLAWLPEMPALRHFTQDRDD